MPEIKETNSQKHTDIPTSQTNSIKDRKTHTLSDGFFMSYHYMAVPPGATIQDLFQQRQISSSQAAASLQISEADLQNLFRGQLKITSELADQLGQVFQIRSEFWLNLEEGYRDKIEKVREENAARSHQQKHKQKQKPKHEHDNEHKHKHMSIK